MYKNLTQFTASEEPQASWSLPHCYNHTHILGQGHPSRSQTKKSSHRQRAFFRPIPRIYLKDLCCEGWEGDMCYFRQLCCFITSSNSFYHIRNIKSIKKFFTAINCVCFIKTRFYRISVAMFEYRILKVSTLLQVIFIFIKNNYSFLNCLSSWVLVSTIK